MADLAPGLEGELTLPSRHGAFCSVSLSVPGPRRWCISTASSSSLALPRWRALCSMAGLAPRLEGEYVGNFVVWYIFAVLCLQFLGLTAGVSLIFIWCKFFFVYSLVLLRGCALCSMAGLVSGLEGEYVGNFVVWYIFAVLCLQFLGLTAVYLSSSFVACSSSGTSFVHPRWRAPCSMTGLAFGLEGEYTVTIVA